MDPSNCLAEIVKKSAIRYVSDHRPTPIHFLRALQKSKAHRVSIDRITYNNLSGIFRSLPKRKANEKQHCLFYFLDLMRRRHRWEILEEYLVHNVFPTLLPTYAEYINTEENKTILKNIFETNCEDILSRGTVLLMLLSPQLIENIQIIYENGNYKIMATVEEIFEHVENARKHYDFNSGGRISERDIITYLSTFSAALCDSSKVLNIDRELDSFLNKKEYPDTRDAIVISAGKLISNDKVAAAVTQRQSPAVSSTP